VRHVPEMRVNLILTGKLDDVGFISYFGTGKWKLAKRNIVIARGSKVGSLYIMQGRSCSGEANVVVDSKYVWHKRLGHMSEKALHMLAKNHLPGIKGQILESCTGCSYGKQCRVSFQRLEIPQGDQRHLC